MKWRLKRPIGTVEGYESELLNENGARIATVYCGFNPFPKHAAVMMDAPEAVEACLLFSRIYSEVGYQIASFHTHELAAKYFQLVGSIVRSQGNITGA